MNIEELIHHLISDKAKERKIALGKIHLFAQGGSSELSLQEKEEVISHFRVLQEDDLYQVCSKLVLAKETVLIKATVQQAQDYLSRNQREAFIKLLLSKRRLQPFAIQLTKAWKSRFFSDKLVPLLESEDIGILKMTIETLSEIAMVAYLRPLKKLIHHPKDSIRDRLAKEFFEKAKNKTPKDVIETCLKDSLASVRHYGLRILALGNGEEWIPVLKEFIYQAKGSDEVSEALRLIGETRSKAAIDPLVKFLFVNLEQSSRWACLQALDLVDQVERIKYYRKMLNEVKDDDRPQVIELIGYCEGRETYLLLKEALEKYEDPGMRSLIAGAMGTCGYPECEKELLAMMNMGVAEAYGAAAALKNLAKSRVMEHFETFLKRHDVDVLVKQIILQHVGEGAKSMPVNLDLVKTIESFLTDENDNMRYLSLVALKNIASEHSIKVLLGLLGEKWVGMFMTDLNGALIGCCNKRIKPFLELMLRTEESVRAHTIKFLKSTPLVLTGEDLEYLDRSEIFRTWKWDEDLMHCVEETHKFDKSLIWKLFSKKNLSEKLCCFLARGFDKTSPRGQEILEPSILVDCFSRFQTEKPLLLLGKLMSNFPRIELLPPLIQFSEHADPDTQAIFRSFVRKMIQEMGARS